MPRAGRRAAAAAAASKWRAGLDAEARAELAALDQRLVGHQRRMDVDMDMDMESRRPAPDVFWQQQAQPQYGVLEVDAHHPDGDTDRLYVRSLFWGLSTPLEAELLAILGNNAYASYDGMYPASGLLTTLAKPGKNKNKNKSKTKINNKSAPAAPTRMLASYAYAGPGSRPCFWAFGAWWRLPASFAVVHRTDLVVELMHIFTDTYFTALQRVAPDVAHQEHQVLLHLCSQMERHAASLPRDMLCGTNVHACCFATRASAPE